MRFFLCVIGMVLFVEGIPYFACPDKLKPWLRKLHDMPETLLRRLGLILMIVGMLLVYIGRDGAP